jgi:hypothetical protein
MVDHRREWRSSPAWRIVMSKFIGATDRESAKAFSGDSTLGMIT